MSPTLTFLGAAGTVTGAKFLLTADGTRLLMECGMFQGLRELRARNWAAPPVEPGTLAAVLLSHAHIDHSGYLPRLTRDGFKGPIFCSPGTADLLRIMLPDADCCTLFVPKHPATRMSEHEVGAVESRLEISRLVTSGCDGASVEACEFPS